MAPANEPLAGLWPGPPGTCSWVLMDLREIKMVCTEMLLTGQKVVKLFILPSA